METREVIIIGSGPAGLTAAIYTARANLHPLVIEGIGAGGQLMLTTDVENYPGFPNGILGPELMAQFREQAVRFGAEFVTADADRVDLSVDPKRVWVGGTEYAAHTIIISTGAQARMLGLDSEQRSCSATACRRARRATASSSAATRSRSSAAATPRSRRRRSSRGSPTRSRSIHRRKELRASKIMQDRAFANPKIEFRWNSVVERRQRRRPRRGARCCATSRPTRPSELAGHRACSSRSATTRTPSCSSASSTSTTTATSSPSPARRRPRSPGVFAGGDVQDRTLPPGDHRRRLGCMAALEAERYLEALGDRTIAG